MSCDLPKLKSRLLAEKARLLNQIAELQSRSRRRRPTSSYQANNAGPHWRHRLRQHLLMIEKRLAEVENRRKKRATEKVDSIS